nr:FecR domain-containing protein [uncultured Draconibacterium sp.]
MQDKRPIKSLIIAELDGDISFEEKKLLYNWISKSETNARYYTQIKDIWEASLADASELAQTPREWERLSRRIAGYTKDSSKNIWSSYWPQIAAVLIIGLLITSLSALYFSNSKPIYLTSAAPQGSVAQTILPDGTSIFLNAGSELKYDVNPKSKLREVFINGEAWFNVEQNKKRPFIVHTSFYDVKVLGTKFNVKAYKEEETITTTLEEGLVHIISTNHLRLEEEVTLHPGQQLVFNKNDRNLQLKNVDTRLFTSWRNNQLIFLEMSFGDLVQLLERKYGVEIEVVDESILKEHYTGTIKNESILEILNIIKHTHPIGYDIKGQKIFIHKKTN